MIPASDASLEDENLPGEDAIPLLLQIEVVGVLQEHLGPAQLVVRLTQHRLTDPGRSRPAVNLRRNFKLLGGAKESIPPACVAWRAVMTTLFVLGS